MRIGIDGGCWANDRGYGRFARELLAEMPALTPRDELVFFLDRTSSGRFGLAAPNVLRVEVPQSRSPAEAAAADGSRSPRDMLRFTRAVWREKPDVFFFPSVYTYFPLPPGMPAVVGIHDAIAERFPELTLPTRRARLFWNAKVRLAVAQATLILSVSEFAAEDVARVVGVPRTKMRVAVEAPAESFRPSETQEQIRAAAAGVGLPEGARWFIYVGGFSPHKNLDVLVRALARVVRDAPVERAPRLLLVGKLQGDVFHLNTQHVRETIDRVGLRDHVLWTGFVEDEELRHLHAGAIALVLPSDCEGFGLPAVEAAACGTPVVATTESPLPQLLAGGGLFVPPRDVEGLARAMSRIAADEHLRCALAAAALERAGLLSWGRCAAQALAAIREAAARPSAA